jgi:catechol 2,3-dioxygenase-like lactoylglutathione lyase family enzyme
MQATLARLSRVAPELPSSDLQRALAYYCQKLGFHVAVQRTDYAIVERDDVALHLFQSDASLPSPMAIHIFTADLDDLFAELSARGAHLTQPIERKPWGNRDFRVKDQFGNELKFTEPLSAEDSDSMNPVQG